MCAKPCGPGMACALHQHESAALPADTATKLQAEHKIVSRSSCEDFCLCLLADLSPTPYRHFRLQQTNCRSKLTMLGPTCQLPAAMAGREALAPSDVAERRCAVQICESFNLPRCCLLLNLAKGDEQKGHQSQGCNCEAASQSNNTPAEVSVNGTFVQTIHEYSTGIWSQ